MRNSASKTEGRTTNGAKEEDFEHELAGGTEDTIQMESDEGRRRRRKCLIGFKLIEIYTSYSFDLNCKFNETTYCPEGDYGTEGSGSGDYSGDMESSGDEESDGSGEANSTKDEIVGNIADLFGSLNPVILTS